MIVLNLPRPPSVNALFFNKPGKGRIKTSEYRSWRTEAGWILKVQKQEPIKGPVSLNYEIADEGRVDLGNLEKALTDLLVSHGMIDGDGRNVVRKIAMQWADVPGVRVTVEPIGSV